MRVFYNKLKFNKIENGGVEIDYQFTQLLKGLACIVIALHHYSQIILDKGLSDNPIYFIFSTQGGYAGVALFFFLSGYGLMESEVKQHLNIFQFIKKRFWKIYKAVLIINTIEYLSILCWRFFQSGVWGMFKWENIFSITHQDGCLWFIKVLFVCYAVFFICTRSFKNRNIFLVASVFIVPFVLFLCGVPLHHLMSIPLFFTGALVSNKKELSSKISKNWITWIAGVSIVLLCVWMSRKLDDMMPIHIIFNVIMILIFVCFCSLFKVSVRFTPILGMLSFPIYLVHYKIIDLSLYLGHLAPVWLFLVLTIYFGWLLEKNIQLLSFTNNHGHSKSR